MPSREEKYLDRIDGTNRINILDSISFDWDPSVGGWKTNLSYCVYISKSMTILTYRDIMLLRGERNESR